MRHLCIILMLLCTTCMVYAPSLALDFPRGPVILTVSGLIGRSNKAGQAILDAAALRSLPQTVIRTNTPWTEGMIDFEGPLLRDVLKLVGAEGDVLRAKAINDYYVEIPLSDALRYDVILAMRMNGREMTVRSKGPLWVIYPWNSATELRSETYYSRSIWQLMSLDIQ